MLKLIRSVAEKIMIDDDIVITVLTANNGKAQLGIHAPNHDVYREELYINNLRSGNTGFKKKERKHNDGQDE